MFFVSLLQGAVVPVRAISPHAFRCSHESAISCKAKLLYLSTYLGILFGSRRRLHRPAGEYDSIALYYILFAFLCIEPISSPPTKEMYQTVPLHDYFVTYQRRELVVHSL